MSIRSPSVLSLLGRAVLICERLRPASPFGREGLARVRAAHILQLVSAPGSPRHFEVAPWLHHCHSGPCKSSTGWACKSSRVAPLARTRECGVASDGRDGTYPIWTLPKWRLLTLRCSASFCGREPRCLRQVAPASCPARSDHLNRGSSLSMRIHDYQTRSATCNILPSAILSATCNILPSAILDLPIRQRLSRRCGSRTRGRG